jgi:hypothetical protein
VNNKTLFLIQITHPSWSKSIKTFFALIIISSLDIFCNILNTVQAKKYV